METYHNNYLITDDKSKVSLKRVGELLGKSYWADDRSAEKIEKSIKHSICFSILKDDYQVGFARVVTDYATMFWLCDVIIDDDHRGQGLGKALMKFITEYEELNGLRGILATADAHGLYEQFGFEKVENKFMRTFK